MEEFLKEMAKKDVYYIGYSNGFSFVNKAAKKQSKKNKTVFVRDLMTTIGEEIKRVEGTKYPDDYKLGYNMALSVCRLSMLRYAFPPEEDDANDGV